MKETTLCSVFGHVMLMESPAVCLEVASSMLLLEFPLQHNLSFQKRQHSLFQEENVTNVVIELKFSLVQPYSVLVQIAGYHTTTIILVSHFFPARVYMCHFVSTPVLSNLYWKEKFETSI